MTPLPGQQSDIVRDTYQRYGDLAPLLYVRMRTGDQVTVAPSNPLAVGRGIGTVKHVGETLVRVTFPQWPNRAIACLRKDCSPVPARQEASC